MAKAVPTIALVGSPNVGKSTLFNTILEKRATVTGPTPGTTRDRSYGEARWRDKEFILIDTGGLARKSEDPLETNIKQQTQVAIAEADIIVFMADARQPIAASLDTAKELKQILRSKKLIDKVPVFLVANKVESPKKSEEVKGKFKKLGLGEAQTVSALTGRGVGDLLDRIVEQIDKLSLEEKEEEEKEAFADVSIIGRPNAGKSTLLNHLAGSERAIVSPMPGTTRATVEIDIEYKDKLLRFIDTAGMRRRAKIDIDVEEYALFQAVKSIESADVVVLLMDADDVRARYEQTIAGKLRESIKGIVLALNKIDLLEDDEEVKQITEEAAALFPFLPFARIIPISAQTGANVPMLLDAIIEAKESRELKIPDEQLKKDLRYWLKKNPPRKLRAQKKPIIYELKQLKTDPPIFELIVNEPAAIHHSYIRHLENRVRENYGFLGTAIKIRMRRPQK